MTMQNIFIVIAVQVVFFVIIYFYVRRMKKNSEGGETARLREELNLLVLELNQTTDRNITLLEDRVRSLKSLVEEADKRIKVLNQETSRKTVESSVYTRLGKLREEPLILEETIAPEATDRPETKPDDQIPFVKLSQHQVTRNDLKDMVIKYHRQGLSQETIAAKLGVSLSEVELVIALYK
jgi:hypothetical protein